MQVVYVFKINFNVAMRYGLLAMVYSLCNIANGLWIMVYGL